MNRHLGLFLLTALTTTAAGAEHYNALPGRLSAGVHVSLSWMQLALGGLWFSVPFLGFLTAHEFGHYFAARWHGLRPSLPYYLPAPLPLTGSLGAVIVFRGQFPNRRVLFDFAAGGPIAGFVVAVVALVVRPGAGRRSSSCRERFVGVLAGRTAAVPVALATRSPARCRSGWSLNLHPTALAGWLGLLFTMMNLVPISQLDGGHIAYAALRRHSRWLTLAGLATLTFFIVWWRRLHLGRSGWSCSS